MFAWRHVGNVYDGSKFVWMLFLVTGTGRRVLPCSPSALRHGEHANGELWFADRCYLGVLV